MYPEPVDSSLLKIDLYSDTATKPTREMREFMCAAEVGDEQRGEDPSVNELQEMVADILGKEAALLLPSGTMCNQIAFAVHCRPGDMVLLERNAHPLHSEAGGAAVLASATLYPVDGVNGHFTAEHVADALQPATRYWSGFRLVAVEQTTNRPGGRSAMRHTSEACRRTWTAPVCSMRLSRPGFRQGITRKRSILFGLT